MGDNFFNIMLKFTKIEKRGRHPDFKCCICGRFVPYDRRKIIISEYTIGVFNSYEEQWFPEDCIQVSHKKCETKLKKCTKENT